MILEENEFIAQGSVHRFQSTEVAVQSEIDHHQKEQHGEEGRIFESSQNLRIGNKRETRPLIDDRRDRFAQPPGHVTEGGEDHEASEKTRGEIRHHGDQRIAVAIVPRDVVRSVGGQDRQAGSEREEDLIRC